MVRKHHLKENIAKLRVVEIVRVQGGTIADLCRGIGVGEPISLAQGECQPQNGSGAASERACKGIPRLQRAASELTLYNLLLLGGAR